MKYVLKLILFCLSISMISAMEFDAVVKTKEKKDMEAIIEAPDMSLLFAKLANFLPVIRKKIAQMILQNDFIVPFLLNRVHCVKTFSSHDKYNTYVLNTHVFGKRSPGNCFFSESGSKIATTARFWGFKGMHPSYTYIYDVNSEKRISTLDKRVRISNGIVRFNKPETMMILADSYAGSCVKIFDVGTGSCLFGGTAMMSEVTAAQFDEAGNKVFIAYIDGRGLRFDEKGRSYLHLEEECKYEILVWDSTTESVQYTLKGHADIIISLSADKNDARLISGSEDGTARVWNLTKGTLSSVYKPNDGPVRLVQFNEAGDIAYTITKNYMKEWSVQTGKLVRTLNLTEHGILGEVNLAQNGECLLSSSVSEDERTIKIWNKDGKFLGSWYGGGEGSKCTLSQDGKSVFASSRGIGKIFNLDTYFDMQDYLLRRISAPEAAVLKRISNIIQIRRKIALRAKAGKDLIDENGKLLSIKNVKFDFHTCRYLETVYDGLPEVIRKELDPFVIKTSTASLLLNEGLSLFRAWCVKN